MKTLNTCLSFFKAIFNCFHFWRGKKAYSTNIQCLQYFKSSLEVNYQIYMFISHKNSTNAVWHSTIFYRKFNNSCLLVQKSIQYVWNIYSREKASEFVNWNLKHQRNSWILKSCYLKTTDVFKNHNEEYSSWSKCTTSSKTWLQQKSINAIISKIKPTQENSSKELYKPTKEHHLFSCSQGMFTNQKLLCLKLF